MNRRSSVCGARSPILKYVFLTRRDKVEQAVSYFQGAADRHLARRQARCAAAERAAVASVAFDLEQIDHWVRQFAEDEASWCRYFEATEIEPFEVVYEDFLASYESTVLAILGYLNIATSAELRIVPAAA